jgi:hypothetical protein
MSESDESVLKVIERCTALQTFSLFMTSDEDAPFVF